MLKTITATLALVLLPAAGLAQTLSDLDWLSGRWVEQRDDGTKIEITWSPAANDAAVGTWRIDRDGEIRAYEMLTLRQDAEGIVYRFDLYRLGDDFTHAARSDFRLQSVEADRAVFLGQFGAVGETYELTLELDEEGRLVGSAREHGVEDAERFVSYTVSQVH